jgi:hypothetical protein
MPLTARFAGWNMYARILTKFEPASLKFSCFSTSTSTHMPNNYNTYSLRVPGLKWATSSGEPVH